MKLNAKFPRIQVVNASELIIYVDKQPHEGKANRQVCELLAEHFGVSKSKVTLLHGARSKRKIINVEF